MSAIERVRKVVARSAVTVTFPVSAVRPAGFDSSPRKIREKEAVACTVVSTSVLAILSRSESVARFTVRCWIPLTSTIGVPSPETSRLAALLVTSTGLSDSNE